MFNSFCFYLNVLRLSWIAAGLRFLLWVALRPAVRVKQYSAGEAGGYRGWVEAPGVGVLAFITPEGTRLFKW
jgi:hypothetical protein